MVYVYKWNRIWYVMLTSIYRSRMRYTRYKYRIEKDKSQLICDEDYYYFQQSNSSFSFQLFRNSLSIMMSSGVGNRQRRINHHNTYISAPSYYHDWFLKGYNVKLLFTWLYDSARLLFLYNPVIMEKNTRII